MPGRDRVALVTGAARGLGAAIARELHAGGTRVAVLDLDEAGAVRLAEELDPESGTAVPLAADVNDAAGVDAALTELETRWHAPDILVNNAARTATGSVWDIELEEWDAVLGTNLRSVLIATRRCAPAMRERGWGRIVNMASLAGQQGGLVAGAHYAAAKAGVLVLTKIFARDLAASGVTVNAVAPAAVRTPVMDDMDEAELERAAATIPVGRLGTAGEVAALVAHLCAERSGYLTGTTVDINGGVFMR
ncbi:SDR family NAD(P)-dependent oxidoreductase [Amycolatopsis cihanbeyliensis]|uniref:3-oxoacyl-[acyl-carrier protein] reductase n=1 Tax=Amycolatopsis cihanbeyliensis TaxID=1128664 RepID=A0A542DR75_AMYCI|nr:SDR family NAD(P)-dependent oxidoreductase [Amycolatopsis cihanbeyliensis]TQJ05590.1 3-oxoacyl-[acyl-carrier protein] reductase [Amycolatopsis cihanbeyliensis]